MITNIIAFIVGFSIGLIVPNEVVYSRILNSKISLKIYIGTIVTIIWVVAYIMSFVNGDAVDPYINVIFGGIVTAIFGEETVKNITKK